MIVLYVLLMLVHNNSILLTHRVNTAFGNGLYALPGGKCEHNETATDAIAREAQEDLGITLNKQDLRVTHVFHRNGTENHLIALIFTAEIWSGNIVNNEPVKCDEVVWFALNQLPGNMISAHAQAIACIKNNEIYSEHGWGESIS